MADDDDLLPAAVDCGSNVLEACAWRQTLVRLGRDVERARKLATGFAGSQKRAGENHLGPRVLGPQSLTERTGLLVPLGRERPQLVRLSGGRVGVSDEEEAHGA